MRPFLNSSVTYIDAKYTDASEAEKAKILHILICLLMISVVGARFYFVGESIHTAHNFFLLKKTVSNFELFYL